MIKYSTNRWTAAELSRASSTDTLRLSFPGVGVLLLLVAVLPILLEDPVFEADLEVGFCNGVDLLVAAGAGEKTSTMLLVQLFGTSRGNETLRSVFFVCVE
jgi:hypothetical protein